MIQHVAQQDRFGCTIACCAMITRESYATVRKWFGGDPARSGYIYHRWHLYLNLHGFALQHIYPTNPRTNTRHDPWPPSPWCDLHVASVDAGMGEASHAVVVLRDGKVLDPATLEARTMDDYTAWGAITGVFPVSSALRLS